MTQPLDDTVRFDAALTSEMPDVVYRSGKVFQIGDYPDKGFSLTEEEADRAIAEFTPVHGNLEHRPTVLSGKVGTLMRVWREGKDVLGQFAIPAWLDPLLSDEERKVSAEWDREDKFLRGWGWTLTPRVPDAVLMSAYAEFAARTTPADPQPPTPQPIANKENKSMTFKDKVAAWFSQGMPAEFDGDPGDETTTPPPLPPPAPEPVPVPPPSTDAAKFSALEQQVAALKREKVERDAAEFAGEQIRKGTMFPAERAAFIAAFTLASSDDERDPQTVTFSEDGTERTATRVATLQALFSNRPSHGLFEEQVKANIEAGQYAALFSKEQTAGKDGPLSDDEKARLLALSPIGVGMVDEIKRLNGR